MEIWKEFAAALEEEFRIIAVDLPGHGLSGYADENLSMHYMATGVRAIMEHERVYDVSVIGHSMGGYVSAALAEISPDYINRMVFLHSHAASDDEKTRRNRERLVKAIKADKFGFIQSFFPSLFAAHSLERMLQHIQDLKLGAEAIEQGTIISAIHGMKERPNRLTMIESLNFPILFIGGSLDDRIKPGLLKDQASRCKNGRCVILEDVNHMSFWESPEVLIKELKTFLSGQTDMISEVD